MNQTTGDSADELPEEQKKGKYPDFKDFIPAATRRRMSTAVKMGIACAVEACGDHQPDAIIVGTGMGCTIQTLKFLDHIKLSPATVSPTSFIQSTHNTVAGQIAIHTGNTGYNMTFSQGGFSFESALIDAVLKCMEGQSVLVGGVDEYPETIERFQGIEHYDLSEGAGFFFCSPNQLNALAKVDYTGSLQCQKGEEEKAMQPLLDSMGINTPEIILRGYSVPMAEETTAEERRYSEDCGVHMVNAAFGLQRAVEHLQVATAINHVAVLNRYNSKQCGLTIVSKP